MMKFSTTKKTEVSSCSFIKTTVSILVFICSIPLLSAQGGDLKSYFSTKLIDIKTEMPSRQTYEVSIKRQLIEPVQNKVFFCDAVKADHYVYNNDSVSWKNVSFARLDDIRQNPTKSEKWTEFDNFAYKTKGTDFLTENFYQNIPQEKKEWARMIVADAVLIEMVWYIADSLEYKKEFTPKILDNLDIAFDGSYTLSNKYLKYVWSGIGEHNGEICAIVKFESLFNPFHVDMEEKRITQGRSMYYGEMWISMRNKQVEYTVMVEDVVFDERGTLYDMQREVVFNKVK